MARKDDDAPTMSGGVRYRASEGPMAAAAASPSHHLRLDTTDAGLGTAGDGGDGDGDGDRNRSPTISLLQQSAGKLGPLASADSAAADDASDSERRLRASYAAARRRNGNGRFSPSVTSPSMARARKIMGEVREMKERRQRLRDAGCRATGARGGAASPTGEGSTSSDGNWGEESDGSSSNADAEAMVRVGRFIDSLREKNQEDRDGAAAGAGGGVVSPRYRSSLDNARNAMAASPIVKGCAPSPRSARSKPATPAVNGANILEMAKNFTLRVKPMTPSSKGNSLVKDQSPSVLKKSEANHKFFPEDEAPSTQNQNNALALEASPASSLTITAHGSPHPPSAAVRNLKKDVHYYAILAQVQNVVRSDNASMSLGRILADANKRGMSLDAVTEIYKSERFKATSQRTPTRGVGGAPDREVTPKVASNRGTSPKGMSDQGISPKEMTGKGITPRGSSKVGEDGKDEVLDRAERSSGRTRGLPEAEPSSQEVEVENVRDAKRAVQEEEKKVETSISGEIADDMKELSRLCDQATALFDEGSMGEGPLPSIASDVALNGAATDVASDDTVNGIASEADMKAAAAPEELPCGIPNDGRETSSTEGGRDDVEAVENLGGECAVRDHNAPIETHESTLDCPSDEVKADAVPVVNGHGITNASSIDKSVKPTAQDFQEKTSHGKPVVPSPTASTPKCKPPTTPSANSMAASIVSTIFAPKWTNPGANITPRSKPTTPRANVTPRSKPTTPRSNVTPRSKPTTPRSTNVTPRSKPTTPRSNVTPRNIPTTPRSTNVTPRSKPTTPRFNVNPRNVPTTPRTNVAPKNVPTTSRSNVTPRSKPMTPRSNVTPRSKPTSPRSNVSPRSKPTTPGSYSTRGKSLTSPLNKSPDLQECIEQVQKDFDPETLPGLNESQLCQLEQLVAEELRSADLSPQSSIDDATEPSQGSPILPVSGGRNGAPSGHEEIDEDIYAFFSRFSISETMQNNANKKIPNTSVTDVGVNTQSSEEAGKLSRPEISNVCENEPDEAESLGQGCVGKMSSEYTGTTSVQLKEASYRPEVVDIAEEELTAEMEWELEQKYHPRKEKKNLPKHLGLWTSPWERNRIAHSHGSDAPASAGTYSQKKCGGQRRQCFLPLENRLTGHTGFRNIDFYSLYEATVVQAEEEDIDKAPWEYRDVGQFFLHEKSLESRNWFGTFEIKRGNDRVPNPVCRPKSLQLSVTKIAKPGEWSEDWYTTWKSRRDNPNNLVTFAQAESENFFESSFSHLERSPSGKKVVEIGSFCPVRVRAGEGVSRVHTDFTSSLRQSRWRKKYLKGSLFPRD